MPVAWRGEWHPPSPPSPSFPPVPAPYSVIGAIFAMLLLTLAAATAVEGVCRAVWHCARRRRWWREADGTGGEEEGTERGESASVQDQEPDSPPPYREVVESTV